MIIRIKSLPKKENWWGTFDKRDEITVSQTWAAHRITESPTHKLTKPTLKRLPSLKGLPNLMRRTIDHIPSNKFIRDMRKITLFSFPLAVFLDFDSWTDDNNRGLLALNGAGRGDFVLTQWIRDEVLLQFGLEPFPALVCRGAIDAVFSGTTFE